MKSPESAPETRQVGVLSPGNHGENIENNSTLWQYIRMHDCHHNGASDIWIHDAIYYWTRGCAIILLYNTYIHTYIHVDRWMDTDYIMLYVMKPLMNRDEYVPSVTSGS